MTKQTRYIITVESSEIPWSSSALGTMRNTQRGAQVTDTLPSEETLAMCGTLVADTTYGTKRERQYCRRMSGHDVLTVVTVAPEGN